MMHVLILIFGFMLLPEASAFKCYTCNRTDTNPNNDDCSKAQECFIGLLFDVQCFYLKENNNFVAKGCLPKIQCALIKLLVPENMPQEAGCCDGELCNAATASTATSLLLLMAPALSVAALLFS